MPLVQMREPNYLGAGPTFGPRGAKAVLKYNGLLMNDRRRMDRIVITEAGGLDDPDVRDARDPNPDRDGETPLDALYSGRTITLKGYIQAGNVDMMDKLWSDLKDAFDDLAESPLNFRWYDWIDEFTDSGALGDYTYETGSGLVIASDGSGLSPTTTALKRMYLSIGPRFVYKDLEMTAKVNQANYGSQGFRFVMARNGAAQRLVVGTDAGAWYVRKVVGGVSTDLTSVGVAVPIPPGVTAPYWMRVRKEGNLITAFMYYTESDDSPPLPGAGGYGTFTYTLAGGDATMFGAGVQGGVGFEWAPGATTERIPIYDVAALNPGDPYINARKFGKIDSPDNQPNINVRRDFLITLRASDPRFVSRKKYTTSVVPTSFALTFDPGGAGITFPISGAGLIFGSALPNAVINMGRSPASPVIRFYGAMTNPAFYHPLSGRVIGVNGVIADGDYLEFDVARRTVFDSTGIDRYDMLTDETNWLELLRGSNTLTYGADAVSGGGKIVFYYRHSSR